MKAYCHDTCSAVVLCLSSYACICSVFSAPVTARLQIWLHFLIDRAFVLVLSRVNSPLPRIQDWHSTTNGMESKTGTIKLLNIYGHYRRVLWNFNASKMLSLMATHPTSMFTVVKQSWINSVRYEIFLVFTVRHVRHCAFSPSGSKHPKMWVHVPWAWV